jgi:hypothetical protein
VGVPQATFGFLRLGSTLAITTAKIEPDRHILSRLRCAVKALKDAGLPLVGNERSGHGLGLGESDF